MHIDTAPEGLYGLMAEFEDGDALIAATTRAKAAGYHKMDGYSPIPLHGMSEALGQPYTKLPWVVFACGLLGGIGIFSFMCWVTAVDYPLVLGGKPLISWPAYLPITFEVTVLLSGISCTIGMFAFNGLPEPYHPVFNAEGFERASSDRFFLCIESADPKFDENETRAFLEGLGPNRVVEVMH